MRLSVILPTHRPDRERLRLTLAALRAQTLAATEWETLLVDNASDPAVDLAAYGDVAPANLRRISEPVPGLTFARIAGLNAGTGELAVFVDDDNLLAPDYLAECRECMAAHPTVGAAGGKSLPRFTSPPPAWTTEFHDLLALRDLGEQPKIEDATPQTVRPRRYPACAPIGAGLVVRRSAVEPWLARVAIERAKGVALADRRGTTLSSAGDNDLIFTLFLAGSAVAYFPSLRLQHLIPETRLTPKYLERLNRGIQRSWVQVLARHEANPWKPIPRWTVPLRQARAFLRTQAWKSPAHRVRWQGLCGRFEGLADLTVGRAEGAA